jgi:hypothetical protein
MRNKRRLLSPQQISDFRPGIDRVDRINGKTFVTDTEGQRAAVEVRSDVLTPEVKANLLRLPRSRIAECRHITAACPYLSREGRAERLAVFDELEALATPRLPCTPRIVGGTRQSPGQDSNTAPTGAVAGVPRANPNPNAGVKQAFPKGRWT